MRIADTFNLVDFANTTVCLLAALALGTLIGAERQYRQRSAGLRTNVLVALGAAAFVDLAVRMAGVDGGVRVLAYVVSGIGFLGAGAIMKEGFNVRGLNTAATLWCSAAVGGCAGSGYLAEAALLTVLIISGNTLLRPLVNAINRIPFDERATEANYEVRLTVAADSVAQVRESLVDHLERAHYPVASVETEDPSENDQTVEVVASLVSTSINPEELDAVLNHLEKVHGISHATWEMHVKN
ncbi:MgtC/SapB family protein [Methylovirgula sp. 4M-Z18]|uniref:MgtC/SapB family protein n=1 Tax=Methylovirgula sp. 4M-Z18 TaxID=2293567 RepID=UPI000E2FC44B|nr:MgtC/SapB family protein [Methylovirgula sp. 4M-Z18]RFB78587.1 MgtC/SapB family protein [Methylovirgula sp. 4M-Z18]